MGAGKWGHAARAACAAALGAVAMMAGLAGPAEAARPGTLDPRFGDGGFVDLDRAPMELFPDLAFFSPDSMTVADDGRIVVAGVGFGCLEGTCVRRLIVSRYLRDGSVDGRFGEDGSVLVASGPLTSFGRDSAKLAVGPSGGLVVTNGEADGVAVFRLGPGGRRDTSFAGNGKAFLRTGHRFGALRVDVGAGGEIVLVKTWDRRLGDGDVAAQLGIWRLRPDGRPDTSFGEAGSKRISLRGLSAPTAFAAQAGGGLLFAGRTCCGRATPYVTRLRSNGSRDPVFDRAESAAAPRPEGERCGRDPPSARGQDRRRR